MSIIDNYKRIRADVRRIATSVGRDPDQIKIVAVSKTFPASTIRDAIDAGLRLFGESRVQEARSKIEELKGEYLFHLVGHLQSNKAKDAIQLFDVIHSIDKLSTAIKVDSEASKINKIQKILIQVNTTGERTKSGVRPDELIGLCRDIMELKNIEILGLMTIGPFTEDKENIRRSFRMLKDFLEEIASSLGIKITELSMGMSSDYPIAIEEGATMLRIGSAIFGERDYSL